MPDVKDKEAEIFNEIRRRAREDIRFGEMVVSLKIHDGKVVGGTLKEKEVKLG